MAYLGSTPTTQSFISGTDYFNGDGATTAFTLTRRVNSVNDIEAVINNVVQQPNTAYTLSGTTITFTSAPSAGTGNIYVRYLSTTTQSITPSQNTVSYSSLNSDNQSKLGISFKNRIINGAMMIDQRNAGASVSNTGTKIYSLDRWFIQGISSSKFTAQQNAGGVTPPAGFVNYLGITSSASTSVGSGDYYFFGQSLEGLNVSDLGWGTANAKTITISAWVYSSITGTFGGALRNSAATRSYPFSYSISAANTWTQISITVVGDSSGTWLSTNGIGIDLDFNLGSGSSLSGTAGAWSSNNYVSATGATSVVSTNGATFYITGVQFEIGTQATTFDYRDIGRELSMCQRYYEKLGWTQSQAPGSTSGYNGALLSLQTFSSGAFAGVTWQVPKRDTPNLTSYGSIAGATETVNIVCDWNFGTSLGAPTFQRTGLTNFNYFNATASSYGAIYRLVISAEL